jgi:hypothetical protein
VKEQVFQAPPRSSGARISRGAERIVSTRAGRFKTAELRIVARGQTTRVWRSDDVPLWGLIRAKGPEETLDLVAFSREGARSAVPEPRSEHAASAVPEPRRGE